MTRLFLLFVAVSLCLASEPGEWHSLLQKDSFDGWRSPSGETELAGAWTLRGGVLTVKPYVHRRTDLWSVDNYENFELEWEWKAAKAANSGVKYWVRSAATLVIEEENKKFRAIASPSAAQPGEITLEYTVGLEYQMADDAHEPDSLKRKESRAGGLYSIFPPEPEAVKPHGQWNRSRLVVRDGRFEHWLNGKRVLAYDLAMLETKISGRRLGFQRNAPIALQYHQTVVSFRKMRVRRF
jgi:hypothetical protein